MMVNQIGDLGMHRCALCPPALSNSFTNSPAIGINVDCRSHNTQPDHHGARGVQHPSCAGARNSISGSIPVTRCRSRSSTHIHALLRRSRRGALTAHRARPLSGGGPRLSGPPSSSLTRRSRCLQHRSQDDHHPGSPARARRRHSRGTPGHAAQTRKGPCADAPSSSAWRRRLRVETTSRR